MSYQNEEQTNTRKILYKKVRRLTIKALVEVKDMAHETIYKGPDTKEGENGIYKLKKGSRNIQLDLEYFRFIKDEEERVLVWNDDIICRWYDNFQ